MADIVKSRNIMSLEAKFHDGDTRTILIKDPADNLTEAQIKAIDGAAIVGDKAGADFSRWKKAKVTRGNTVYYDITDDE